MNRPQRSGTTHAADLLTVKDRAGRHLTARREALPATMIVR
jgi:hypothetical protein